ncbi:MAG TPA: T9SS type A sorting domain-containing protein [Chitinophagaceae bacterium]|nr:T9SS type A sorting domain-containing protein [Chitinophagaceae bacterium]
MKKVLSFSVGLIFIANYLVAQVAGDYLAVANGNWTTVATWQRYNGTAYVAATDYPGQNTGTGEVIIGTGLAVTLNVSPLNPIGALTIDAGSGTTSLTISNTFILNVTGSVFINQATGGAATKSIVMNGATAQLNAAALAILPSNNINKTAFLQFNGGIVNITGNVAMAATAPLHQRTLITFPGGGTLTIGGTLTGGTINSISGTTTINATSLAPVDLAMTNIASTLLLNANTTVAGTLTLTNGKIDIGANTLTLSNATPASQLVGGSSLSYVYTTSAAGRLERENLAAATNYTFPVGTPTATYYMPVIVNTVAGTSSFAVSVYSPAATNATVGGPQFSGIAMVNAMWYVERSVGSGNSSLTFQWVDALEVGTFGSLTSAQIGISRNDNISWSLPIQTSANAAANTVTASFSAFGAFVVAQIGAALPVKFGSIKAYEKQNGIQLDWKVYSENKVKSYEIERSADARSYNIVGSLPALYNNTADGDYGFFDANPLPGISYYRIKNNDIDGKSAYSIVIRVNRNKSIHGLSLYPNPVLNRIVSLQGSDLGRGNYKISIFAANGQEIYKQQIKHNGGTISQTIELPSTISKGIYMFTVKDENGNIIFNDKLVTQ